MNEEKPVRIGDQEREEAVTRLGAHYEAGRLTADEHQERVGEALQAKTQVELAALFADLPGESNAGQQAGEGEQWAGPWGWARPPWTAPQDQSAAQAAGPGTGQGQGQGQRGPGGPNGAQYGPPWAQYGPPWARGRGPLGRIPFPLLIVLGVAGVLASVGCVVLGGHPPVLPLVLIVAGVVIAKKRRQERRA
jgi:hypothetical protein